MLDNSKDRGYIHIRVKENGGRYVHTEFKINQADDEHNFYVDYENGCIYIDFGDENEKKIIGYYETVVGPELAAVYDSTKKRIIGRVGNELIYFRKRDKDTAAGRYWPEEECLAWYNQNSGSITTAGDLLTYMGIINGSEIGGAATFVSVFYNYIFKGMYRDFFEMEYDAFKNKYNM